jgi:S-adenosylmethionine decarboxylase proenzyme
MTTNFNGFLGNVVVAELYGCDTELLKNVPSIEEGMLQSAEEGNAHIVSSTFKQFDPWGVSGVIVIQESHFAIHTWPEHNYAAVDIFTCGNEMDPKKALKYLSKYLRCKRLKYSSVRRGNITDIGKINGELFDQKENPA